MLVCGAARATYIMSIGQCGKIHFKFMICRQKMHENDRKKYRGNVIIDRIDSFWLAAKSHYVPRIDSIHRWPDRLSNHSQFSFIFFLWNFVKQSNEHWDLFLVVNKLERLIWLDNHCLTLNQSGGKKIGWMLMGIFLPTEVNWGNQSHRHKKIEQKNEEKRQNKTE